MNQVKSIIALLSLLAFSCSDDPENIQICNSPEYRYYYDEQLPLPELQDNYVIIGIDTTYTDIEIGNFIGSIESFDQNYDYTIHLLGEYKFRAVPLRLHESKTCEEITALISALNTHEIVSYTHYAMQTNSCMNLLGETIGSLCVFTYASSFYVKVHNNNNLNDLHETIAQTNTEYIGELSTLRWHKVRATKTSNGDALRMANYFHETGLFEVVDYSLGKYAVE